MAAPQCRIPCRRVHEKCSNARLVPSMQGVGAAPLCNDLFNKPALRVVQLGRNRALAALLRAAVSVPAAAGRLAPYSPIYTSQYGSALDAVALPVHYFRG